MRVDNEKELEMNRYEKMSWEIIKEKKKVKLDFEITYFISLAFFMVLSVIFGMKRRNIELDLVFTAILLGWLVSILLGFVSCFIVFVFLKISIFFILLKDREYQLAKEVMLNYSKKVEEKKKRNECIDVIQREKEKHERIYGLERYLEDERKGK